ncbi:hypothetical protein JCM19294_1259 [Nonlabens tegetincola]|uniref:Rad50/SbcC-type AAA domain-containing protein n=1 Tax=Nonlabens tegetincola TaxID=323273 RepID=A0A090Q616_9FLAO|nr:AAA family ATPase [Nonlabens tegetincola]GAK97213.1 hypothetical protein JCM19294_1259 [Nonlabens tegetincola]
MKIKKLEIESFRGIPNKQTFSFENKSGKPISTLIFGDNGSGKSSIIDALEFNLQGKIERSDSIKNQFRASVLSLKNHIKKGAKTKSYLENNSCNERNINVSFDEDKQKLKFEKSNKSLHPNFQIAPIALRRNDIISYSTTPVQNKQILFWKFIYNSSSNDNENSIDNVLIQNLDTERIELKSKRRIEFENLAKSLKTEINNIPKINTNEYEAFVKNKIRKGLTNKQYNSLKQSGKLRGVNEKAVSISSYISQITKEIRDIEAKIKNVKSINSSSKESKKNEVKKFLSQASKHLTIAFKSISTVDFIKDIEVLIGELTEVSFEIKVTLQNGKTVSPSSVFSEANLDLLILLLYTSIIKESNKYGQSKLLILDDVLQSVDSTIRLNFLDYLVKEYSDWQLIISAHDRLWLNQIRSIFRRNSHVFKEIEIYRWNFSTGPQIFELGNDNNNNALQIALNTKNTQIIASQAGLFLETICNKLSMNLNTSIQRKIEDKYTMGDLWPGIKKHFKKTELRELTEEIDKLLHIRNLLGAHYNEWSISLSTHEVLSFAKNILEFYEKTFCPNCQSWLRRNNFCECKRLELK